MPSPLGHAMAGAAVMLLARPALAVSPLSTSTRLVATGIAAACVPDVDLLFTNSHRVATHSVFAVGAFSVGVAVAGSLLRWPRPFILGLALGCAYGTHLLLDWLGEDMGPPAGIQAFWPWSDRWFVSGTDLFDGIDRFEPFKPKALVTNALAVVREIAILGPICYLAWRLGRLPNGETDVPRA